MRPVLIIAGPTAAGKTAVALRVAHRWGACIVSADAMQVYRGMDIGTGKAPPAALRKYPHACVDIRDPGEPFSAQDFTREADGIVRRGEPVVVVGGTVFYIRAFLFGLAPTPEVDPALRDRLTALPDPHSALIEVDPVLAARLHPNDKVRIVRGLEVFELTGRPLSSLHAEDLHPIRHSHRAVWLDRDDLRERIFLRVRRMMRKGYLDEVRRLLGQSVDPHCKPMQSLGYRHLTDHILDGLPLEEAIQRTCFDTWHFARKQRNWARQHPTWDRVDARDLTPVMEMVQEMWGPGRGPRKLL